MYQIVGIIGHPKFKVLKWIWNLKLLSKIIFFIWLVITRDFLSART